MPSYKGEVQTGTDPKWYANALAFKTKAEADRYVFGLAMRWTSVTAWRVVESNEPVNYICHDDGFHHALSVTEGCSDCEKAEVEKECEDSTLGGDLDPCSPRNVG